MLRFHSSVVLFVSTVFFAFLQDACALPAMFRRQQEHGFDFSKYTVPLSDGPSTLPPPSPTLALKAITLARGYQNYTCKASSAPPTPAGALATLYDATPLLTRLCAFSQPAALSETLAQTVLNFLTHYLYRFAFPASLTSSKDKHGKDADADNDGAGPTGGGIFDIPVIGHHFFDAALVPTWDLRPRLGVLKGKKAAGIKSSEAGSVDWLVLDRVDDGYVDGKEAGGGTLKEVYRVETVGGVVGGECEGKGTGEVVRVRYSAQYWFYG